MRSREDQGWREDRPRESSHQTPPAIGEILEELFARYQARFPDLQLIVIEEAEAAAAA